MRVVLTVAACVLALGMLCAGMDCESIDRAIDEALQHYEGRVGVSIRLLSVLETPATDSEAGWIAVSIGIAPVVPNPVWSIQTWRFAATVTSETGEMPPGVQMIERERLLPCSEIITALPDAFPVARAAAQLYFPLTPTLEEPIWGIEADGVRFEIGAYTGILHLHP